MAEKVIWKKRLSFEGRADSGFTVPLGTDSDKGGDEDGFKPMELIALGLAGCTAMDVISIMQKKRQDVTDFEVTVYTERAEQHPRVFTWAQIEYAVTGHEVDEKALARSIELSATRYCPAQGMFHHIFPIDLKYCIYEDEGEGERRLVVEGTYTTPEKAV
jgi:putative redox protein